MDRRLRNRRRIYVALALIGTLVLMALVRIRLYPIIDDFAVTIVENEISDMTNQVIYELLLEEDVDYNDIVTLEKDAYGNITALQTDMVKINYLKARTMQMVDQSILEVEAGELGVPVGNLILPEFFAGQGFYLPIKILSVRSDEALFHNNFMQAGINQTIHQMSMEVALTVSVLTPSGTHAVGSSTEVVIAETVIVGSVPESYFNVEP
ncbi:MAG: sporulation protein YunB [Eubacteriales bacterium]